MQTHKMIDRIGRRHQVCKLNSTANLSLIVPNGKDVIGDNLSPRRCCIDRISISQKYIYRPNIDSFFGHTVSSIECNDAKMRLKVSCTLLLDWLYLLRTTNFDRSFRRFRQLTYKYRNRSLE